MHMHSTFSKIFLFLSICTLGYSCSDSQQKNELQEGDLLFQNLNCGELCDAIEAVTEGVNGKDFSHCAIVVNINDTLKVVEAIGEEVQITSIENFFARSGDTAQIKNITIGRVNPEFETLIPNATAFAKQQIGQPYDNEFILENGQWYCSELVYESFKAASNQDDFFNLAPMTFKDPKTNTFYPAWMTYYKELGAEIPEGKEGINPGLISRSNKIHIVTIDHF